MWIIKKNKIVIYILVFGLLYPFRLFQDIYHNYWFIVYGIKPLIVCLVILYYLYRKVLKEKCINRIYIIFIVLILYNLIITLMHDDVDIMGAFYQNSLIAIALICYVNLLVEYDYKSFIISSYIYLSIPIVLLFFFELYSIMFLSKIDQTYVFWNRNLNFHFYFPLIIMSKYLDDLFHCKYIKCINVLLYFIILFLSLLLHSMTTFITSGLLIIYILFLYRNHNKLLCCKTYVIVIFMFFVFVVLPGTSSMISRLMGPILGKDITLSGRSNLYDLAHTMIAEHPLFGYGYMSTDKTFAIIGNHTLHNIFFDFLMWGGVPSLSLFIYLVYYIITSNLKVCSDNNRFLLFVLFVLFIRYMLEVNFMNTICYDLSLVYFLSDNYNSFDIKISNR